MKAKIIAVEQGLIPQFDNSPEVNADVPTVVVLTTVEFWTDEIVNKDGSVVPPSLHSTQQYGCKPEDYPADNYQGQADAMQADIEHTRIQADIAAQNEAAAAKVAEVRALITNQQ